MRLTPRDTTFFDLFAESASHLVRGAELLGHLLGAAPGEERAAVAQQLVDAEHAADESTHAIMRRMNSTFVTPFDREDIYSLASGLDDCMDFMEAAAELVVLYKVDVLPAGVSEQVAVLQRQAELTAAAMPRLRAMRDLADYWVEINRLENTADRIYRSLVADLFEREKDAIELLKVKEVIEQLEFAADAFEKVAHTVEQLAAKES
jgi:predicted phosphate transport protein (TIGR00153 family)